MGEIYTVKQIAEKLQLHPVTVYLLIEDRKLDCKRIGRSIRVTEKQFNDYIEKIN